MIDTSDGLLADLGHVAQASGVAIDVETGTLDLGGPLAEAVDLLTKTTPAQSPALTYALTGGEDHSLAATFPASTALPPAWRVIGTVRDGSGVTVDGGPHAGPGGWEHFR
jgi:thiamine-monophosphate kinase